MAAQKGILAAALAEQAIDAGNPVGFLKDLVALRFSRVNSGSGRVTISTSQPGSSATWIIPAGFSDLEIIEIARLALNIVRSNVNAAGQCLNGVAPANPIEALPPAERGVSYGIFSSIAR